MGMTLRNVGASPFGRKVRLAAAVLGLADQITIEAADTMNPEDSLRGQNPLGKIPALILDDGRVLYDSRVIIEYLDTIAGGVSLSEPLEQTAAAGVMLVGDAARHIDAITGGGVANACLSGRQAGRVAVAAMEADDFSVEVRNRASLAQHSVRSQLLRIQTEEAPAPRSPARILYLDLSNLCSLRF